MWYTNEMPSHLGKPHKPHGVIPMGQLADLLRDSLRELAQSDARRLREMDKLLKELKELEKKPPL